jgi:hypothetical protein
MPDLDEAAFEHYLAATESEWRRLVVQVEPSQPPPPPDTTERTQR